MTGVALADKTLWIALARFSLLTYQSWERTKRQRFSSLTCCKRPNVLGRRGSNSILTQSASNPTRGSNKPRVIKFQISLGK